MCEFDNRGQMKRRANCTSFHSGLLPCFPQPSSALGFQCCFCLTRAKPARENHQGQVVVIVIVWGLCLSLRVSIKGEHDFGLIVTATVTAALLSPCAAQAWTSSSLQASNRLRHSCIPYPVYFSCLHVLYVKIAISKTSLR